jgi:hypothetical protein
MDPALIIVLKTAMQEAAQPAASYFMQQKNAPSPRHSASVRRHAMPRFHFGGCKPGELAQLSKRNAASA